MTTDAISKFSLAHPFLTTFIAVKVVSEVTRTVRKFFSLFERAPKEGSALPEGSVALVVDAKSPLVEKIGKLVGETPSDQSFIAYRRSEGGWTCYGRRFTI